MRIDEIGDDSLLVQSVDVGTHCFDSGDEIEQFEYFNDIKGSLYFITAEAFKATHDYMRDFCRHLLEEIRYVGST